jgi:hypothetical protein
MGGRRRSWPGEPGDTPPQGNGTVAAHEAAQERAESAPHSFDLRKCWTECALGIDRWNGVDASKPSDLAFERAAALLPFRHHYNRHRPHLGIKGRPFISRIVIAQSPGCSMRFRQGSGSGIPAIVRRMASSAPMARRRAVAMMERVSA